MKEVERTIHLYRKVDVNESMEERHEKVMEGLSKLEAPLGLKDSEIPEVPDFGIEIRAYYRTKNSKTKGVSIEGVYRWRGLKYVTWDELLYEFKITYNLIDYKKIIYEFPDEEAKGHFDKWLENNKFYKGTIDEIRIRK